MNPEFELYVYWAEAPELTEEDYFNSVLDEDPFGDFNFEDYLIDEDDLPF